MTLFNKYGDYEVRFLKWWKRRKIEKLSVKIALINVDKSEEMRECREQAFNWARKWMRLYD